MLQLVFFFFQAEDGIRDSSVTGVQTCALPISEGVTNTYGSYTLVRSGIWSKQRFYADLGQQITELEGRPSNRWQSAEQSSLDAWLEKYPLYNQEEYSVSYYTNGTVLRDFLYILIPIR